MPAASKQIAKQDADGKRAQEKARMQAIADRALAFIAEHGPHCHAKEIEHGLGLSKADGDRLYLFMKSEDGRFAKGEPRIASFCLSPAGKRAQKAAQKAAQAA